MAAALAACLGAAVAAPLPKESCDGLKAEQTTLAAAGLRADMARGAAWAKVNLAADRMNKIARLIDVDAEILFRCKGERAGSGDDDDDKPARPAKPAEKDAEKPDAAAEPAKPPNRAEVAAEKKRRAAAAKAKADDAYVPPNSAPQSVPAPPAAGSTAGGPAAAPQPAAPPPPATPSAPKAE